MRNEALFDKIAAQIEETPELYRQHFWVQERECGTAYCVAGWALTLSGYQLSEEPHPAYGYQTIAIRKDGVKPDAPFEQVAAELLGLNSTEAHVLFSPSWMEIVPEMVPEALRSIGRGGMI